MNDYPTIVVCAHTSRRDAAVELDTCIRADDMVLDDGSRGSTANHRLAWDRAVELAEFTESEWVGVVEDDAIPVPGIVDQLPAMLAESPSPLVSAYLGTSYPRSVQGSIRAALDRDPTWIMSTHLLHHVAVFARVDVAREIVAYLADPHPLGVDTAIGILARRMRWPVSYPVPSLFDHADERPVIPVRERPPTWAPGDRVAWSVGTRDEWGGKAVPLDQATVNAYPAITP